MFVEPRNPILEIHDLMVGYSQKMVLWGVDLKLPQGALIGIIGPNGAGKSTLLKSIMGLIPLRSGYVRIFDKPLDQVRGQISYVPQKNSIDWNFPTSVLDVVLMGRYRKIGLFKKPRQKDYKVAQKALERLGIDHLADRQISQLSGGQQQRTFLARALAQEADLYFMDEPFAGIDATTEKTIVQLLKDLKSVGKTVVMVHHDLQSVKDYFDWVTMLNMRLVANGPIQTVFNEKYLSKTYGGKLNILAKMGEIAGKDEFFEEEQI